MKIMITGSGGREHALAWRAAQSPTVEVVYLAPGNAGTDHDGKVQNVEFNVMDFTGQIAFARREQIDLTIIGPEAPLVAGVVDQFQQAGLQCFGPNQQCAQLEGSKAFTKAFLKRHQISTPAAESFSDLNQALAYVHERGAPIVIKADGLAAGKGVVVAKTLTEAEQALVNMLQDNLLGDAGARVVVEDFLAGEEASFIVIADGKTAIPFASSQDHKAAYDANQGPNTGGMGAYSPAPVITQKIHNRIMQQIINPTILGMAVESMPYTGFLYAGLMIDTVGKVNVIEFNCRFGDPETQPVMMRMQSDLPQLCLAALEGSLADRTIEFCKQTALTVVLAAGGYPNHYEKGNLIQGIAPESDHAKTFHAGTVRRNGQLVTHGGRVLGVTAMGDSVKDAQKKAYDLVANIEFKDLHYRTDIGYRAVQSESRSQQ